MNKDDLNLLKLDIICKKIVNIKDILELGSICLNYYFNSTKVFGKESEITKDIIKVWKEYFSIVREENKIYNFLIRNYKMLDVNEVEEFMAIMYELCEKTMEYYYKVLEDIDIACDMEKEWKGKRCNKIFNTLIEDNEYREKIYGLTLKDEEIENYLGYPKEFWDYIDVRTIIIDSHIPEENDFCGINLKIDKDILVDIKVFVPDIVNLETALINIYYFNNAYDLYCRLGQKVDVNEENYRVMGQKKVEEFKTKYLKNKCSYMFKN